MAWVRGWPRTDRIVLVFSTRYDPIAAWPEVRWKNLLAIPFPSFVIIIIHFAHATRRLWLITCFRPQAHIAILPPLFLVLQCCEVLLFCLPVSVYVVSFISFPPLLLPLTPPPIPRCLPPQTPPLPLTPFLPPVCIL